jgi:hypothetical protein
VFEGLRDALRAALARATPPPDLRELTRRMREAVVDAKVGVGELAEALARTAAAFEAERQRLADAERRGRLAAEIRDEETVAVAERFAAKHRERVSVLEHKLAAQREELALAERELGEMREELRAAELGRPAAEAARSAERAWRDVQAAGGAHPEADLQQDLLRDEMDRRAQEIAAEERLRELKERMRGT